MPKNDDGTQCISQNGDAVGEKVPSVASVEPSVTQPVSIVTPSSKLEIVPKISYAPMASPITVEDHQAFVEEKKTKTQVRNVLAINGGGWKARYPGNVGCRNDNVRGNRGSYERTDLKQANQNVNSRTIQQRSVQNVDGRTMQQRPIQNGDGRTGQRPIQNGDGRTGQRPVQNCDGKMDRTGAKNQGNSSKQ